MYIFIMWLVLSSSVVSLENKRASSWIFKYFLNWYLKWISNGKQMCRSAFDEIKDKHVPPTLRTRISAILTVRHQAVRLSENQGSSWKPPLHTSSTKMSDVKCLQAKGIILDTVKRNFPRSQTFTSTRVEEEIQIHELFEDLRAAALLLRVNRDMDWFKPERNQMRPQQFWITGELEDYNFCP